MPSARANVATVPVTPDAAVGAALPVTRRGGQFAVHAPVQVTFVAVSAACVYRVRPFAPTRMGPRAAEAPRPIVLPDAAAGVVAAAPGVVAAAAGVDAAAAGVAVAAAGGVVTTAAGGVVAVPEHAATRVSVAASIRVRRRETIMKRPPSQAVAPSHVAGDTTRWGQR